MTTDLQSVVAPITLRQVSDHVAVTPGICGGRPHIKGHRIKVQHVVVWHYRMGLSPDEIVCQHPGITLADIHAALAFYWDHQQEIDTDIKQSEDYARSLEDGNPSLLDKIKQRNAANDSIPPG